MGAQLATGRATVPADTRHHRAAKASGPEWCHKLWVTAPGFGIEYVAYLGLFVSLLDGVSCDFCVAIVLRWGPFQGCVEAPRIDQLHAGRRTRQLWEDKYTKFKLNSNQKATSAQTWTSAATPSHTIRGSSWQHFQTWWWPKVPSSEVWYMLTSALDFLRRESRVSVTGSAISHHVPLLHAWLRVNKDSWVSPTIWRVMVALSSKLSTFTVIS